MKQLFQIFQIVLGVLILLAVDQSRIHAADGMTTWDGKHDIQSIEVTMVYFLPRDRVPLPDWKERLDYFARRIEKFHEREFQGQSKLRVLVRDELFRSKNSTAQLRSGDVDRIFWLTLQEVDRSLRFGSGERSAYPILLVMSDINWGPLEDFYRLRADGDSLVFEGQFINGRHFPGARSGGARSTYLADRGIGWGLVSADGWRVPYAGTDCVAYHEGIGHPVGLPHPEPPNPSVMSAAQYRGWISESWIDDDQKQRLGWVSKEPVQRSDLFSTFRALPEPLVPKPNQDVALRLELPPTARAKHVRVRYQTELFGPWVEPPTRKDALASDKSPLEVPLGQFDRATPVSYRVDISLEDGQTAELWGYFQVRTNPLETVMPVRREQLDMAANDKSPVTKSEPANQRSETIDLLARIDPAKQAVSGKWTFDNARLESPKAFGARLELPYEPIDEYELTVVAEPLDEPNGLILGQCNGANRFLVLINFAQREGKPASALENVDGMNVNRNETTVRAKLLERNRPFQIVCTVRKKSVLVQCDGHEIIRWQGEPNQLNLSDYWNTPNEKALFVGAYDCRFRFDRITVVPLKGDRSESRANEEPSSRMP